MYFDNLYQLITMDGHGVYVWTATVVTLAVLVSLIVTPLRQHRKTLQIIAREIELEQLVKTTASQQEATDASNP